MVIRRLSIVFLALSTLVLNGCIEHRADEEPVVNITEKEFISKKEYKGLRIYEGTIPCADCAGIEQRLVLKGDSTGIYRLTEVFKNASEDGDEEIVSLGEWKFIPNAKKPTKLKLSEGSLKDTIRWTNYTVLPTGLQQLDIEGESIPNKAAYQLKLIRRVK